MKNKKKKSQAIGQQLYDHKSRIGKKESTKPKTQK